MLAIVNCLAGNSKFIGHSRRLHISLVFSLDFNLSREGLMDFPSNIKGEYTIYLKHCHFHRNTNLFNYLSMPVLSTIVQKGGDCKSKFLPRRFWRLLSKNSRGTNMHFEYKQIIRFLKDGVCVEKFEG